MISILSTLVLCLTLLVAPVAIPIVLENIQHFSNGLAYLRVELVTWRFTDTTQQFNVSHIPEANNTPGHISLTEANATAHENTSYQEEIRPFTVDHHLTTFDHHLTTFDYHLATFPDPIQTCALVIVITVTSFTVGLYVALTVPKKEDYVKKHKNKKRVTSPDNVSIGGPYYLNKLFCGEKSSIDLWAASDVLLPGWFYEVYEQKYTILGTLGRGAFGKVSLVRHKENNQLYAMKEISKAGMVNMDLEMGCTPGEWSGFINCQSCSMEKKILELCKEGPNMIKLFEVLHTKMNFYFITSYCAGGTLRNVMNRGPLPELYALRFIKELLAAIVFLHDKNIIHRDIKPSNILVHGDGSIKLADFGLSIIVKDVRRNKRLGNCGTAGYMAPEVIMNKPYNRAVDYFSVGVVFYEMVEGQKAYPGRDTYEIYQKTCTLYPDFSHTSSVVMHVIEKLMEKDPRGRMTGEYVNHFVFTDMTPLEIPIPPNAYLKDESDRVYFNYSEEETSKASESYSSIFDILFYDF